jgi:hypothetical protein
MRAIPAVPHDHRMTDVMITGVGERGLDVLTVRIYERPGAAPIVPRWLTAARSHLPEAVPLRFGATEPLRGRFDRLGDQGLLDAYAVADSLLFLLGSPPVHHASLSAPHRRSWGPTVAHALDVEVAPDDERVRRFVFALAGPATVYLSASVSGGLILDRRTLVGPPTLAPEPFLAARGDWLGLPPSPPSWCWFGPCYVPLVRRAVQASPVSGGLLWTGGPWVPDRLRARLAEIDPARWPARRMPRGLRRSLLRQLRDGVS